MLGLVLGVGLVSLRWLPLLLWLPGLGLLARLLTAVLCAVFAIATAIDRLPKPSTQTDMLALALPLAHELAVGLFLLLLASTLWAALQAAARLAGLTIAQPGDGVPALTDETEPAGLSTTLTTAFALCGTALFFAAGGLERLVAVMAKSYELWPLPGSDQEPAPGWLGPTQLVSVGARLFALALVLALPVLVPRLLAQAALALWPRRRPASPTPAAGLEASLRALSPLLWLLCLTLGAGAALSLWLQQGPALLHMLLLPASTQRF